MDPSLPRGERSVKALLRHASKLNIYFDLLLSDLIMLLS